MPNEPRGKFTIKVPRTEAAKPLGNGLDVIKGVRDLIARFGNRVEPALYVLLCDQESETRAAVDKALKGGSLSATAVIVPLLISQFGLAPAVATMVAAVAIQAVSAAGQEKLCEVLAEAKANVPAPKPVEETQLVVKPATRPKPIHKPKPKPKPATKPKPKPRGGKRDQEAGGK